MAASNKIQVGYIEAQDGAQFQIDAGTAAAPGLVFDDSAATGLYSPGTGQLAFSTSSKQTALRILADGKVGIDCSPTVALEVNGTIKASAIEAPIEGTLDDWIVHAGDTNTKFGFPGDDQFEIHAGGGPKVHVNSSGYVGINTSTMSNAERLAVQLGNDEMFELRSAAQELFQVWKEGSTEECRLNVKHGGSTKIHLRGNGNSYINGGDFGVGTNSPTARFDVRRGDADGKIAEFHQSTGYGIDIGSSQALAYISSGYNQAWAFKTDAGSGQVERLRIASDGDVTIGKVGDSGSNPSAGYDELCIEGGNEDIGMCFLSPAANTVKHQISFGDSNNNQAGRIIYDHDGDYMSLYTSNGERLHIASSGNVHIGSGSPTIAKLQVSGAGLFGSANTTKTNDGVIIERNSGDGIAHITAGRSGGNYSGFNFYVAGASGVTLRHQIDYQSNFKWYAADGTTERLRIASDGQLIHKTNKASGYIAEFHQEHADNPGTLLIDSPTNNNIRPSALHLAQAGTVKWVIGQVYSSTSDRAFHICAGTGESNSKLTIDTAGRVFIGRVQQYASSSEKLSVNGMTSIQFASTSAAGLYIFNTDSTSDGTVQPYIFFHDGSGIRGGLGVQRNTGRTILNGQFGVSLRSGSTGVGGTERLHVASDGTVTLKNNSGMMMDLQSSAGTGQAWIEFSDTDGTRKGYFGYGSSNSEKVYWVQSKSAEMSMYSNGNDRFTVQSNGNKVVKNGRLNISSTFIDFSGSISTPSTAAAIYRPADNQLAFSTANVERVKITNDGLFIGDSSNEGRIRALRNVGSTAYIAEFRNQHSVYGGGVQFKSNNTYGTLELVNYNASGNASIYNSTGGWHWTGNLQTHSHVSPWTDDISDLGTSSKRWDDIYATNDTIETSDRNKKENIAVSDLGLSFVNKLKPVSFKRKGKTRTHYGLIAQDIETLLSDIGKSTTDFAAFIKTEITEEKYDDARSVPDGKNVGDIMTPAHTAYGLRYNEFIAPLIKAIQELSAKVDSLETEVASLKGS